MVYTLEIGRNWVDESISKASKWEKLSFKSLTKCQSQKRKIVIILKFLKKIPIKLNLAASLRNKYRSCQVEILCDNMTSQTDQG